MIPAAGCPPFWLRACFAMAAPWLSDCATVVVPPADPPEPVPVFLLVHEIHSSLVLPGPQGHIIRYSYGDWDYYALRKSDPIHGLIAISKPTRSALGRRMLPGPPEPQAVKQQVRVSIDQLFTLRVDAGAVQRLREELDGLFQSTLHTRIYNEAYDMEFVEHPVPYTLRHNSNYIVGEWLQKLGCEVRGKPVLSNWIVETK